MSGLLSLTQTESGPFIERLGWVLMHSLWQFALIAFLAILFLSLLRKSSAALRHGALMAHLALLVMAPLCTWFALSPWTVPSQDAQNTKSPAAATWLEQPDPAQKPTEFVIGSPEPPVSSPIVSAPAALFPQAQLLPSNPSAIITETIAAAAPPATVWWNLTTELVRPWLGRLVAVWAVGLLLFSSRPLVGWWALRRLKARGLTPVPESIAAMAQSLARRLGLPKKVEVFQSYLAKTPLVVGYFRPIILLPVSVVTGIPASQLESILIHELAHVRRHDFLVNLLQTLVETVFFYHPAVWFLSSRIRVERENCCDDLVVGIVADRAEYGRALLAVEELRGNQSILALGATHGSLLVRVRRILAIEPRGAGLLGRWTLIGLAPLCLGLGLLFGQLGAAPHGDASIADPLQAESVPATAAESEALKEAQTDGKPLTVIGRILLPDGTPASGALVRAVQPRPGSAAESRRETTADAEGRFQIELPSFATRESRWIVAARRDEQYGQYDKSVEIPPGNKGANRPREEKLNDLKLQPGRKIEGWVLAQNDRKPLSKAAIWSADGQKTETDEKGAFVLHGLSADVQSLLATHPEGARTWTHVDLSEQKIGRVKILLPPGGMIQGEVTHAGQPVEDGHVRWGFSSRALADGGLTETIDPKTGKFTFGGLPFNRLLPIFWFNAAGMEPETTNLMVVRAGQPTVQNLKVALQKTPAVKGTDYGALRSALWGPGNEDAKGSIRGKVLQEDGKPVTEFTVQIVVDYFPHDEGGRNRGGGSFFSEDGTFAIGKMDAGKKYAVAVTSPSYARTVISPITARVFKPEAPSDAEVTEFRLMPATLQVDMVVRDAKTQKPLPDAMVCFKADVWHSDDFSWNLGNHGAPVQWSDQAGKILWDRMQIDKGIFFVHHPGYGRAVLPWRIAKAGNATQGGQTSQDKVPEYRHNKTSGESEVVLVPDPVRPLKRNEVTGRYEAAFDLNPEATLEVKINNPNGRDLNWIVMTVEQMSLPGSKHARSAGNPLIDRHMEEFPARGGLFRFDGLNPGPCKLKIRDLVDEHNGGDVFGFMARDVDLASGVRRLELDLPARPPAKPAETEKKEAGSITEPQLTEFLDAIDSAKKQKQMLLLKHKPDDPEIKKIQKDIDEWEGILKKNPPAPIGSPVFTAGPGKCRFDGGVLLEIDYAENAASTWSLTSATLSLPGLAKKTLVGPKSANESDWGVGWIKGGTTLWAVTRLKQSLKILEVRFGPKDPRHGNEIWSKETIVPWVRGQVVAESGMPDSLAAMFSRIMIGSGPILIHGEGKWVLDDQVSLELKERPIIAPLIGPAKAYVGIVRRHSSNEVIGEIGLGMIVEKEPAQIVIGGHSGTNLWVAQKRGHSGQLSRFDWSKLKEQGPSKQIANAADDFPRGLTAGEVEIPKEMALAMAEQFLILEGKKKEAAQPLPTDRDAMRADSNNRPKTTNNDSKTESDSLKNATALLRERVKLNLEALQSGNAKIEEVLAACKDLAELEPAEALTYLKTILEVAEARFQAGRGTRREVLAVQSTAEVIKLRAKLLPAANSAPMPPEDEFDPKVITTTGSWNLGRGIALEVMEQSFDAPIIGTFKQNVALFRRADTRELIKEIRLGLAAEKSSAYWAIGWMPGRESLWIVSEHDRTQQFFKYRMAASQLTSVSGTSRTLGEWNRNAPISSFGIPYELGYEMASRFKRQATPRRSPGNAFSTRTSGGPAKELLEQVKDLQGSWTWVKQTDNGNAVPSQIAPGNATKRDRLIHLIVRGDQVRLLFDLADGSPILDKSYTIEFEEDSNGMNRLLLRSQNNQHAVPFQFEVDKSEVLSLNTQSKEITSRSRWKRIAGEEKLKGTWALVSGKPQAIGSDPVPDDIRLEMAVHDGRYDLRVFRANPPNDPSVKQIPRQSGSFHLTQSHDQKTILHLDGSAPGGSLVVVWGSHTMQFLDEKTLQLVAQGGKVLEWKRLDRPTEASASTPKKP